MQLRLLSRIVQARRRARAMNESWLFRGLGTCAGTICPRPIKPGNLHARVVVLTPHSRGRAGDSSASGRPPSSLRREPAAPAESPGGTSPPRLPGSTRARLGPAGTEVPPRRRGRAAWPLRRLPRQAGQEAPVPATLRLPRSSRPARAEGATKRR